MEPEIRTTTNREQDEATVKLLERLQEQLNSSDASSRRRAAFNLSWMQEDGFEILKNALYGNNPATKKNAAAYGLRKMRGRMKKVALDVLMQGLKRRERTTRDICKNALKLLGQKIPDEYVSQGHSRGNSRIREVSNQNRPSRRMAVRRTRQ
jgi:HEAT repeat protein